MAGSSGARNGKTPTKRSRASSSASTFQWRLQMPTDDEVFEAFLAAQGDRKAEAVLQLIHMWVNEFGTANVMDRCLRGLTLSGLAGAPVSPVAALTPVTPTASEVETGTAPVAPVTEVVEATEATAAAGVETEPEPEPQAQSVPQAPAPASEPVAPQTPSPRPAPTAAPAAESVDDLFGGMR